MSREEPAPAAGEAALVHALELHFPGLCIVDRSLESSAGTRVGIVARCASGELLLLEHARQGVREAALHALELCAFARRRAGELERRHRASRTRVVLLVADGAGELAQLCAPLLDEELCLFEAGELRSAAGVELVLARVSSANVPGRGSSREDFLSGLEPEARARAEELWSQLAADALGARAEVAPDAVRWSDPRGPLCSLAQRGRALFGRLEGLEEELELSESAHLRGFLDAVLATHLSRAAAELRPPAEAEQQMAFDPRQPILTEAEIAAFHA